MKFSFNFRILWLVIPLILFIQIIAGMAQRAGEPDWSHERVPQVTPRAQDSGRQAGAGSEVTAGGQSSSRPAAARTSADAARMPGAGMPATAAPGAAAQAEAGSGVETPPGQATAPTADPSPEPTVMVTNSEARVPILVYHHVSDTNPGTRYYTTISQFSAQMKLLNDQGYTVIPIAALIDILEGSTPLPPRPIVLTFDDGTEDVYQNAFTVMQEYGFPGVAYLVVNMLDGQGYLQEDEISEMLANGWEVGSHSETHADLSKSGVDLRSELEQSRLNLEGSFGWPVQSFAYPYAVTDQAIFQAVEESGYTNAVCSGIINTQRLSNRYCLSRREILPEMDLKAFQKLIEAP